MAALVPKDKRQLRACLICGIVLNHHTFRDIGCPNCESLIKMRGQNDVVTDCTSGTFDGLMAVFHPTKSWVAKYTHVNMSKPGMYAASITGRIPEDIEDTLAQRGFTYHPRDGTAEE
ncbi:transcription initiation protein spt4 [Kickxella alabastrina]|uniref:transcription initiation protein spt4 n=1 Tax=Kickxella alabastrina TaxID=61397 RepID=UPI002220A82D|nr:transcription initiation protein spt4 [Kickxella alabastrina]XP_051391125.1 transcription initiation protein spt4 [Kickxella alabastrina]KAI7818260.1 transcription initiation protein spt4 [Kickxella alabastrina]KAI7826469.1 transcription initiation protein spt4 [Kickxella alabastrina]